MCTFAIGGTEEGLEMSFDPGYKYDLNGTGVFVLSTLIPKGKRLVPGYFVEEEGELRRYELVDFSVAPDTITLHAIEVKEAPLASNRQRDIADKIWRNTFRNA